MGLMQFVSEMFPEILRPRTLLPACGAIGKKRNLENKSHKTEMGVSHQECFHEGYIRTPASSFLPNFHDMNCH